MEENNIFSKAQHGFVTGRSCSTQLLELMEDLTETLYSNGDVDIIYLDFKKPLIKYHINAYLKKLKGYDIRGKVHSWIKEFFGKNQVTESSDEGEMLLLSKSNKWKSTGKRVGPDIVFYIYK